jgi:predicted Zn-dependent protease
LEPKTYYLLAQLRQRQGDTAAAERSLKAYRLLLNLARDREIQELTARHKLVIARQLERLLPANNPTLQRFKIQWLFEINEIEQARAAFDQLRASAELDTISRLAIAAAAGNADQALLAGQLYRQILVEQPNHREARIGLARLAYRTGDFAGVRSIVSEGLQQEPHLAGYHQLVALVDMRSNDNQSARQHLETALYLAPWQSGWRIQLANLYLTEGQTVKAEQLVNAVAYTDPQLEHYKRRQGFR